ncbi:methyltransferase family protein [Vibrio olivae]|uniref:Methyltransferase family protein n=1 Tax=Vibrio olivae TaxID=1243002 RepID=A0ABV5HK03_9VIBR
MLRKLELKVPPVAVFLILLVAMAKSSELFPDAYLPLPKTDWVFIGCLVIAVILAFSSLYQFRKAKTTVNPIKLHKVSQLVEHGVFSVTRNPMYLSLLTTLFGAAYWLQSWASIAWCWVFILYMNRFQIIPEERFLTAQYGERYEKYKQRVKRWLL